MAGAARQDRRFQLMPSLFTELRRRNVFKVGAAYAIVAWLLLQITDIVNGNIKLTPFCAETAR